MLEQQEETEAERRERIGTEEEGEEGIKRQSSSPITASSQPTGLAPVATGSGKRSHHLQTITRHPHLDRLSAPVTHPVSVTKSNKLPK